MSDDPDIQSDEVPEGAAVFPHIPDELMVNPLLLAVIHATVFLVGSDESIVQTDAADEVLDRMAEYLQRLNGERLRAVEEDMTALVAFAKQEKWPRPLIQSLRALLRDMGVGDEARNASEETDEEESE